MRDGEHKRLRELCEKVSKEQDPNQFLHLILELYDLLEREGSSSGERPKPVGKATAD